MDNLDLPEDFNAAGFSLEGLFDDYTPPTQQLVVETLPAMIHFPAERAHEVRQWVAELRALVNDQVKEMLREEHMLVPDLENLPTHIAQTPAELFNTCRTYVRLSRLLWESEQDLKRTQRAFKRNISQLEAQAAARIKKEAGSDRMTVKDLENALAADGWLAGQIELEEAKLKQVEMKHAEILEHKEGTGAMVKALELKSTLLPGLQGAANAGQRMGMGQRNFQ